MVDFMRGETLFVHGVSLKLLTVIPLKRRFVGTAPDGMITIESPTGNDRESVGLEDVYRSRQDIINGIN